MKLKTTRKAIVNASTDIISIGYCAAQTLLRNHNALAYTCGVYGWNFDVFEIDGKTICTGYRNMPGRTAKNVGEYEKKARAIMEQYSRNWEQRCEDVEKLLHEFLAQA